MAEISFFVPGNPKGLKRHRSYTTRQGIHVNVDPNRQDKMDFLAKAMQYRPSEPWTGPICLELFCVFPRPKNHYRTGRNSHLLKESAPYWYAGTPDADNILKFVGDALNGIFWKDDRQLLPNGIWTIYGSPPGIYLRIFSPTSFEMEHVELSLGGIMET